MFWFALVAGAVVAFAMRKGGFEITTGYRWGDLVAQYFFLVLVCLVAMRKVIMTRIGSMDAIHIEVTPYYFYVSLPRMERTWRPIISCC